MRKAFLFVLAASCAFALAIGSSHVMAGVTISDGDGDGVPDEWDNCLNEPNASQNDVDMDGYGNACDFDYNQAGAVGITDVQSIAAAFSLADALRDNTEPPDGVIGITDVQKVAGNFGTAENTGIFQSGLACADASGATAPCTGV